MAQFSLKVTDKKARDGLAFYFEVSALVSSILFQFCGAFVAESFNSASCCSSFSRKSAMDSFPPSEEKLTAAFTLVHKEQEMFSCL